MKKVNPYFYIIQHNQSKVKYAGCRYTSGGCDPSELLKLGGYLTSSSIVRQIIKREGIHSFSIVSILSEQDVKSLGFEDVRSYEKQFLIENKCQQSQNWFNLTNSGGITRKADKLGFRFCERIIICVTDEYNLVCPIEKEYTSGFTYVQTVMRGEDIFSIPKVDPKFKIRINRHGKNYSWDSRILKPVGSTIGYYTSPKQKKSMSLNGKLASKMPRISTSEKTKNRMRDNHWSKTGKIKHPLMGVGHSQKTKEKIAYDKNHCYYCITSPSNNISYVCSLGDYCKVNNISATILRFYIGNAVPPPKYKSKKNTQSRLNTTGWLAIPIFGPFSDFLRHQESLSTDNLSLTSTLL